MLRASITASIYEMPATPILTVSTTHHQPMIYSKRGLNTCVKLSVLFLHNGRPSLKNMVLKITIERFTLVRIDPRALVNGPTSIYLIMG